MKKTLAILLAVLMIMSTVSFAAPSMAGTVSTSSEVAETVEVVEEAAESASVLAEDEWKHDIYGDLLYVIDFETGHNFLNGAKVSFYGKVNPNYPGSENWTQAIASADTTAANMQIVTENGNRYLA